MPLRQMKSCVFFKKNFSEGSESFAPILSFPPTQYFLRLGDVLNCSVALAAGRLV